MEKMCPCCKKIALRRAIRRGVEIDYCPNCNGIWLDNGELTKIIAESVQVSETESRPDEIAAQKSRKSIFQSFLNVMGSTKEDAEDIRDDSSSGSESESDSESDFEDDLGACKK